MPTQKRRIRKTGNKLDGRRLAIQRSVKKRAAAGHQVRGVGLAIHGRIESKRDPDLQRRIDLVVEMAREKDRNHSTDVVNGFHHVAHASLRAYKVG